MDTNVLVYVFDDDEPDKQRKAAATLTDPGDAELVLSTQVLGELYVTLVRRFDRRHPHQIASAAIDQCSVLPTISIDPAMVRAAIETAQRWRLSYWDALIVEAAVTGGCQQILTEDLQAGALIRGVEIVNPFL